MLGNVYLHYVLDTWFEQEVKPMLVAQARLVRYADDFVMGFKSKQDAERVMEMLVTRMAEFGLRLHPDKTRLVPFGRPDRAAPGGKGPATFDFLGFTLHWRRSRRGGWTLGMKTRKARLQRALQALAEFCSFSGSCRAGWATARSYPTVSSCDGSGSCLLDPGQPCDDGTDCVSGVCIDSSCA